MFQIICKIGPLSNSSFGVIIAIIAVVGIVILTAIACSRQVKNKSRAIFITLFWILVLGILSIIPLFISVTIYSYGLMLAIAVVVCTLMLARDAHRNNIKADIVFDLIFWAVISGIIGARLFYILLNYSFFAAYPSEIFMIQKGGLAWQGGLILGSVTTMLFIKAKKLSLSKMLDFLSPYLALGQSIGRIGCFLNGCCFGKEVDWGVYFPVHDAVLYPTQLYLSGGYFIIFVILKRYQKFSEIPGLIFASYLILASILRFGVEFFRADHEILFLGLSIYQFVSFGILMVAFCFAFIMLVKHSKPDDRQ